MARSICTLVIAIALAVLAGAPVVSAPRVPVDLIVAGDWVVTMDPAAPVIEHGAIAISAGQIVAVGPAAVIDAQYSAARTIFGEQRILMPGLINGHTHAAMTLFRGIADDRDLMDWLTNFIFPVENELVDEDFVRVGTELACWEMIAGGTTSFVDMYFFPDVVAGVVQACGLRAIIGVAMIEQESPHAVDWASNTALATDFVERWVGRHPRITPGFAAHAPYSVAPAQLREVRGLANRFQVPVLIHIAETAWEVDEIKKRYRLPPVAHLDEIGLFAGPVIGAHLVWPDDDEIKTLARRRVGAIHNPSSNLKLASGFAPVPKMIAAGVNVGLGTDGAASNNDLDMWEEIRLSALIHKPVAKDPKAMPAAAVLHMATAGGAAALGMADQTGMLAPGMRADMIQVDVSGKAHLTPMYDPVSHLVYAADAQDVITTIVEGRVLMHEGEVTVLDTARIESEAKAIAGRIRAMLAKRGKP